MEALLQSKFRLLEQKVDITKSLSIELGATIAKVQYHLHRIPWWKYTFVLIFYWLVKIYTKTGWAAFASLGMTVAVYVNLIFVLPRISNSPETFPVIPISNDSKDRVVTSATILNEGIYKKKIKLPPAVHPGGTYAVTRPPIEIVLLTGELIRGRLVADRGGILSVLVPNPNGNEVLSQYEKKQTRAVRKVESD